MKSLSSITDLANKALISEATNSCSFLLNGYCSLLEGWQLFQYAFQITLSGFLDQM